MFSNFGMVSGPLLFGLFILAIIILLVAIIKLKVNAFVALLMTAFITGILANMPLVDLTTTITNGFGSTLGGIGMVTGLGVMLGMFMYEAGGIESIANTVLSKFGDEHTSWSVAISGFITGIPVFGDVVYIMFAPMLRALSKKTGTSMVNFACTISVATTCTYALVLPTAPPLAVSEELGIEIGFFFFYALISAIIGTYVGGILYGGWLDRQDKKNNHTYTFEDLEEMDKEREDSSVKNNQMSAGKALSILLVPIVLILSGSFATLILGKDNPASVYFQFFGNKNLAMLIGVIYASIVSKKHIVRSAMEIMGEAADQIGLILLITGSGGAFGKVLQATGIANYVASTFSQFSIPILILCFLISQIIRLAQGSTTVALITTAAIMESTIMASNVSPILCAIAICAGGIGLSLPNDSGFWAISKFFKITAEDTIRAWTFGGFVAGLTILGFVMILSLFQNFLPGLM